MATKKTIVKYEDVLRKRLAAVRQMTPHGVSEFNFFTASTAESVAVLVEAVRRLRAYESAAEAGTTNPAELWARIGTASADVDAALAALDQEAQR